MKKLLTIFFLVFFITGCSESLKFEEIKADSYTTYKAENIELIFSNIIEDKNLASDIKRDLSKLNNFYPIQENIRIVIDNKYLSNPNIGRSELSTNEEFAKSEAFTKLLIAKAYNIYDNWKIEGIYENIFSNKSTVDKNDIISLKDYYKNNDLSLFGARYIKGFATEEEIQKAKEASKELVKYLIENGKKEELIKEEIKIKDIKEWAEKNNIDISYYEEIYEYIKNTRVSNLGLDILTIESKKEINGYKINIGLANEDYDEAKELEEIIKTFEDSIQNNLKIIKEKAPNFYKDYEKELTNVPKVYYLFKSNEPINNYNPNNNLITLQRHIAQMAEYNHFLFAKAFEYNGTKLNRAKWIREGVDIHLWTYTEPTIKSEEEYIREIKEGIAEEKYKSIEEQMITIKIIKDNINKIESLRNEDDRNLYWHLYYLGSITNSDIFDISNELSNIERRYVNSEGRNYGAREANHIPWEQNFSFTEYMVHEYGLEKMLYFSVGDFDTMTFEEEFGKSFKELERDWKLYLKENIVGAENIEVN